MFILYMEEIKTLKDIDTTGNTGCGRCESIGECCGVCQRVKIRKEAIKWMNTGGSFDRFIAEWYNTYREEDAIYDFIQHFFNITEEDLK